jgi:hypothetical protein
VARQDQNRMASISLKLDNMREREKNFYSYGYLAATGFLPNYRFASSNMILSFNGSSDDIMRDDVLALIALGNTMYYRG